MLKDTPAIDLVPQLKALLDELQKQHDAGQKMLELAAALSCKGKVLLAAYVENQALQLNDPETMHRWRVRQAARAPANQFMLLNNDQRTLAFNRALTHQVSEGDLVLEIGTGSGILAMLAARAGAGHVVTCEHQTLMADIAEEIIRENQLETRITVLPKPLDDLRLGTDLPRRADMLISDLFTGALLEAGGLKLIHLAKNKLLRPEGRIVPARATLKGRLVGGKDLERLCRIDARPNLDLSRFNLFSPPTIHISPERFATLTYDKYSTVVDCFHFDFNKLEGFGPRQRELEIQATQQGNAVGLLQWLKLELSPENCLESDESSSVAWGRYLHVFPNPVKVNVGVPLTLHFEHDWTRFSVWPAH